MQNPTREQRGTIVLDWQDFDVRDDREGCLADAVRAVVLGLPARPGTRYQHVSGVRA